LGTVLPSVTNGELWKKRNGYLFFNASLVKGHKEKSEDRLEKESLKYTPT
jgi:hypothetical protein